MTDKLSDRQQRIYNFLATNPVGVLSTVTPDGDPHGAVIYFTIDKNFVISFLTKTGTRKYDNLKRHSHVMLTVFEASTQATTQITGEAVEITERYDTNSVAGAIIGASMKTSAAGLPPIAKLQAGTYVAFTIKPVQIRMAVYARPDSGGYGELFESIESFELENATS
jgi:hypothetical protein